ncbi:MAG: penicillin-binding transpeptidase domain-containing protein [Bdellovibrionales bacterium]|nr:penicillin-binding transpeptidase domain-containing protein [Bdellovibrionales bacterium]
MPFLNRLRKFARRLPSTSVQWDSVFFSRADKNKRVFILCVLMALFALLLWFKGARLQLFPDDQVIRTKKNLFEKVVTIKPRRGIIYDRYGRELALSVSSHSLFADPSLIKNSFETADKLSRLMKIPRSRILKKIRNKKRRFVWIKRHVSDKEKERVLSWDIHGLGFIEEPKRVYPNETLMSQVLGFTGADGRGLEGLELFYDELLSGTEQKIVTPRDARGRPLFIDGGVFINKSRGSDIYLTIDSDLQFVLERELDTAIKSFKARSAMGLILNAQTSEILALAHSPNFNPNKPFRYSSEVYRNRIAADSFEPGSTFKTFIAAVALKENILPHTMFDGGDGQLKIGKHTIREAEADHKYKKISVSKMLAVSSNVGAAVLALKLTDQVLYPSLTEMGFGEKLEVDFPLEGKGALQELPWRDILTANVGFGQGVSATPLQMSAVYTAIANGGLLKKPYILHSTIHLGGQKKKAKESSVIRKIFTKEQSELLTFMLTQAVSQEGTGFRARIEGFLTAGKTGTAQKTDPKKRGYAQGKYISSFIGFVPADHPHFVIYIAVDEPTTKFYGSTVAAPVFSAVGSYAVRRAGIPPSFVEEPNILTSAETPVKPVINEKVSKEKTPNFVGLSLREAFQTANKFNVKLKVKGSGLVRSSIPFSGESLPQDRVVTVILNDLQ